MTSLKRRFRFGWRWVPVTLFVIVFLLHTTFIYSSLCRTCGMSRRSWQFLGVQACTVSKTADSPLSRFVHAHQYETGPHDWLFCHGGGNGAMCAVGPGRYFWATVESDDVVRSLDAIRRFYGEAEVKMWLNKLIDPKDTTVSRMPLLVQMPADGFVDRAAFEQWWKDNDDNLHLSLRDHPELELLHQTADPSALSATALRDQ